MAATIVNAETIVVGTAVTNPVLTPVTPPSVGNAVILTFSLVTKTRTITNITDGGGNPWRVAAFFSSSSFGSAALAWPGNLGATMGSITLHLSGTSKVQCQYLEVAGLSGLLDSATGANNPAGTAINQAYTSTLADDFIVAGIGSTAVPSIASGPFVFVGSGGGAGLQNGMASVEELATGTYTCHWSLASSVVSSTVIGGFQVAPSGIVLTAPAATVSAAGFLGAPAEKASATLATVSAAGQTPSPRLVALAPAASVNVVGFPGSFPVGSERFRNSWFRPVVDTLAAKAEGWFRFQ